MTKLTITPNIVHMVYGYINLPPDEHQALAETILLDHQDEVFSTEFGAEDMYVIDESTICLVCIDEDQLTHVISELEYWFNEGE